MKKEARFFKSLADETRLKILWLLSGTEELCVCDIMEVLGITQSKASRHLRYLYHLGWVTDRRDGLWMNYRLAVTPGSPERETAQAAGGNLGAPARKPRPCGSNWNSVWQPNRAAPVCQEADRRIGRSRPEAGLKPKNFLAYNI